MSDLQRAIRINEEIKHVVDASRQINIVALNALLTARKAGARSRGFSVASRELRALASGLEASMETLVAVISRLAENLAEGLKAHRILTYLRTAARTGAPAVQTALIPALHAMGNKQADCAQAVARDWLRLERHLHQAMRITRLGGAISRSAKIEAAHGGEMGAAMTQVADQIEQTVGHVITRLRDIQVLTHE